MNTQPWHFTAVTDEETTQKLADAMSSMKPPAGIPGGNSGEYKEMLHIPENQQVATIIGE